MLRAPFRALVALAAPALAGGCQLLIDLDGGIPRDAGAHGGAAGSTSTTSTSSSTSATSSTSTTSTTSTASSTSAASSTSTTSSGTGGMGTGGMDSGESCSAATCTTSAECTKANCVSGKCEIEFAGGTCDGGTLCGTPEGGAQGTCVECNVNGDCGGGQVCGAAGTPVYDTCVACNVDADCGSGRVCGARGTSVHNTCVACNVDADCGGGLLQACSSANACVAAARVLLLAGGGQNVGAYVFEESTGAWSGTNLTATTADYLALAIVPATGQGVGLIHAATSNQLEYTIWSGPAATPNWQAFAQLNSDVTRSKPAILAIGTKAHVVYQDMSNKLDYEAYSSGVWTSAPQGITPAGASQQICGPSPAALAPLPTGPALAYVSAACNGATNAINETDLQSASWLAPKPIASSPSTAVTTYPLVSIVAPVSGPSLLAAYVGSGGQVSGTYESGGSWGGQATLGFSPADTIALAPLTTGGVLLAYRDATTSKLSTDTITISGSSVTWGSPAPFTPSTTIQSTPALAPGVGSSAAEMAYVDMNGNVWHSRLIGSAWTAPKQVAAGFNYVAIASGP